jgi:hypothetical protein
LSLCDAFYCVVRVGNFEEVGVGAFVKIIKFFLRDLGVIYLSPIFFSFSFSFSFYFPQHISHHFPLSCSITNETCGCYYKRNIFGKEKDYQNEKRFVITLPHIKKKPKYFRIK